jgi:hypothetical protein
VFLISSSKSSMINHTNPFKEHICFTCGSEALLVCSGCMQATYCDKICQKKAWHGHKKICNLLPKVFQTQDKDICDSDIFIRSKEIIGNKSHTFINTWSSNEFHPGTKLKKKRRIKHRGGVACSKTWSESSGTSTCSTT